MAALQWFSLISCLSHTSFSVLIPARFTWSHRACVRCDEAGEHQLAVSLWSVTSLVRYWHISVSPLSTMLCVCSALCQHMLVLSPAFRRRIRLATHSSVSSPSSDGRTYCEPHCDVLYSTLLNDPSQDWRRFDTLMT